jgi:hypothetical protein
MTEFNVMKDRISATNWLSAQSALQELDDLKFAVTAMSERFTKGASEAEMARNASIGIKHRIDYLHDSLRRLLEKK